MLTDSIISHKENSKARFCDLKNSHTLLDSLTVHVFG